MLDRRRTFQLGLVTLGLLFVAAPLDAFAQAKPPVKVRYSEVVRSILYAPAYMALANGYFKDAGLDVTMTTAQGGDKTVAALLSNSTDIALIGPETSIYVQNGDSPTKIPIFCGLTVTDGFMVVGARRSTSSTGNSSRASKSWRCGRAARRICSSRLRFGRTASTRSKM